MAGDKCRLGIATVVRRKRWVPWPRPSSHNSDSASLLDDEPSAVDLLNRSQFATALCNIVLNPATKTPLDNQRVRAALDSEIGRIDEQRVPGVLGNHLEAIILWCVEGRDHRVIDDVGDGAAIFRRLAGW